jgi:uncharacterized membrane protein
MVYATASALIILLSWWIHFRGRRQEPTSLPTWRLPLELVGLFSVVLTGHLGGLLSGVNT